MRLDRWFDRFERSKNFAAWLVGIPMAIGLLIAALANFSTPATAAGPSDAEAIVRALDRISARLDHINDTLKDRCGR